MEKIKATKKIIKIAVTGATGNVSYAFLFQLISGAVFGDDVSLDLRLLDRKEAATALAGVMMELQDCASPLLHRLSLTTDEMVAFDGIDWAVLIGAAPRKAGMERADLLSANADIFVNQGKALNKVASQNARVVVVGNPCNTNCLVAMHHAPRLLREHFYALMMLDENRAAFQLAQKANVAIDEVKNIIVWGNHSASVFPDFYHATIHNRPAIEAITDESWLKSEFLTSVRERGAAIIKARSASSAGSAARAISDLLRALNGEFGNSWSSIAKISKGEYGVDEGLIFSFPCAVIKDECNIITGITHNEFATLQIQKNIAELRSERDLVHSLGIV